MIIDVVKLGKVANISSGKNAPKDDLFNHSEGLPFIRASHLNQLLQEKCDYNNFPKVNKEESQKLKLLIAPKNSILFAKSGMSATMNRIVKLKQDCYFVNHLACVTPKSDNLNSNFLKHYLFYYNPTNLIQGEAYPSINLSAISDLQIPLPPLEIQKAIAEKLDKADALRKKDQELLTQYDELAQAIFIDMFGDPVKNEKGWKLVNFEKIMQLKRGYDLPTQDRNPEGKIHVFGSNGVLDLHDKSKTTKPCLITGRSGTIGKVHRSETNCWPLNTTLYSFEIYNNNLIFLEYLLKNFKIERFAHGAGVPTLDRKIVHKEKLPLINLDFQNQFAEKIKNIEAQKTLVKQQAEESENLFQALLQESFNFN
ncbi:hypothetical protein G6R40_09600 [Chryseobacterium sp. POL2]|uniref:restriction endonuclease subunit S n=1 Tax=Chryseobacterium sp. POL2 TaxID=2713414 RepID=UPI0013E173DF|nr:restriction endonuclease subunit S [Chryseobacterium sp. POL2]QIG89898.1 hypothetical protein G6R40_09600 [Chryseobacterium sp. POL2]